MGSTETLRSVIDAGRSSKRLDELSSARVLGKVAMQAHAAQQKAGAGKAVGPITPAHIKLSPSGEATLEIAEGSALGYSSPEQTMGGFGDRRSDVFSLGAVLWEALTYQRLFDAMNDAAVRLAVQERAIVPPAEVNANVPAELSAICMRALNRNPADRYQSLKAMAVEIEEFLEEAGYTDDDSKIAAYLAAMNEPAKVKIAMAPLARPASSTQPPPTSETATTQPLEKTPKPPEKAPSGTQPPSNVLKQPAAPSMLGEPPKQSDRSKRPSGAELAAALASAGSNGSGVAPAAAAPPPAKHAATVIGVPKLDEWQDSSPVAAHSPPPAAAPVVPVDPTSANAPLTPLPPVLPSGSTPLRTDKSTISVSVPPQVKVATVDAKHAEAKQPALIVEDKPQAQIVEDKPPAQIVDDGKATLVDAKAQYIAVPTEPAKPAEPAAPKAPVLPAAQEAAAKPARPGSQSEATHKRAPSHADAVPSKQAKTKSAPHPVAAVSLGPAPKEKDVLAGWGWGTDNHTAIAPDGYVADDDYEFHPEHNARKMLVKIIGAGMGAVLLIIIIAFAFGGSDDKKKKTTAAATPPDPTRPAIDQPPAPPTPDPATPPAVDPAAQPAPGSAEAAATQPVGSAEPSEAEKAKAAADAEAARIAAEQEQAKQAELAKAEAAKVEAERIAAEKQTAEQAKKAEAERIAAEKKQAEETKKQEAARVAAEKKAAAAEAAKIAAEKKQEAARVAAEKKQEAARVAAEKKQEASRIAAEKKAADDAKKQEAARIAAEKKTAPKTAPKTAAKPPKKAEPTRVAKAEPKAEPRSPAKTEGKLDVETAYRVGLQQFARGDTTGALASLRTSLAGNPNYAPTWRGLGLVFEKMGEKDQARAAYKRYLQLAPGANDAEQIKGRLERLGS